jgi:hypothetical protein
LCRAADVADELRELRAEYERTRPTLKVAR